MPVQGPPLTTTKGRALPVGYDGDGVVVADATAIERLTEIRDELARLRVLLAIAFDLGDAFIDADSGGDE